MKEELKERLFDQIIKKNNNAEVIRDIILPCVEEAFKKIIMEFAGADFKAWAVENIFLKDCEKHFVEKKPDNAVFTLERLQSFADRDVASSPIVDIAWSDISLDSIDFAGIKKILRHRILFKIFCGYDPDGQLYLNYLDDLGEKRNEFIGHLTKEKIKECTDTYVKNQIIKYITDQTEKIIKERQIKQCYKNILSSLIEQLNLISSVFDRITRCEVSFNGETFCAKDLYPYRIFLVYPDAKSDKFRRFCGGELRDMIAKSSSKQLMDGITYEPVLYTDEGTVEQLEALCKSSNAKIQFEAKQLLKTLYEPLKSSGSLKVMRIHEGKRRIIDLADPVDKLIDKLSCVKNPICVITDNKKLAQKIYELNRNRNTAVAVKALNKDTVVPFGNR